MTNQGKLARPKLQPLELMDYLCNVSQACQYPSHSRDTFCRVKKRFAEAGLEGLREISRRRISGWPFSFEKWQIKSQLTRTDRRKAPPRG